MKRHKSITLFVLILLFLLPGALAYIFFKNPAWVSSTATNKGELILPPKKLDTVAVNLKNSQVKKGSITFDQGPKWKLIVWAPKHCEKHCIENLEKIARIRLALGRKLYHLEAALAIKDKSQPEETIKTLLSANDVGILSIRNIQELPKKAGIFIVDPNNYLILGYSSAADSKDIYKDIKHLLNIKEQNI